MNPATKLTRVLFATCSPLVLVVMLTSCGGGGSGESQGTLDTTPTTTIPIAAGNVMEFLATTPELSTFYDLASIARLDDALAKIDGFTVFAPSNDAFTALGSSTLDALKSNPQELLQVLLNHVVVTSFGTSDMLEGSIEAVSGLSLAFVIGDTVSVNGASLTSPDHRFSDGYVHIVDAVITN